MTRGESFLEIEPDILFEIQKPWSVALEIEILIFDHYIDLIKLDILLTFKIILSWNL